VQTKVISDHDHLFRPPFQKEKAPTEVPSINNSIGVCMPTWKAPQGLGGARSTAVGWLLDGGHWYSLSGSCGRFCSQQFLSLLFGFDCFGELSLHPEIKSPQSISTVRSQSSSPWCPITRPCCPSWNSCWDRLSQQCTMRCTTGRPGTCSTSRAAHI
jgi:hypothetical protein